MTGEWCPEGQCQTCPVAHSESYWEDLVVTLRDPKEKWSK